MRKSNKQVEIINQDIRVREVRVNDIEGKPLGVMLTSEAQKLADSQGVDLVLVTPNGNPPVARIIDYGKYKYEKQRKMKELKKNQKNLELKEIRVTPQISDHDLDIKLRRAEEFLSKGHKVQFTVRFRGRQNANRDLGRDLLNKIVEKLEDISQADARAKNEGRNMFLILAPLKNK